jgi:bifunctional non-homologous end joining protein LigD
MPAGKKSERPEFVEPMAAKLVSKLPEGPDWIYEVKWDGYRVEAIKAGKDVRLISRNGKNLSPDFPGIVELVRMLNVKSAVLDGEVIAVDDEGKASFQNLQNRSSRNPGHIVYYAFDLLHLNGKNLRHTPLVQRKEMLHKLINGSGVMFSGNLEGDLAVIIEQVEALGLEGIMAKRATSIYESSQRSGAWCKLQLKRQQEFVIGGFIPEGNSLRSIAVGFYKGDELVFAGKVRGGFNKFNRGDLAEQLKKVACDACPFRTLPISKGGRWGEGLTKEDVEEIQWVRPKLVAQIKFTEWTAGGQLRHAMYLGVRSDKRPKQVVKEIS